MNRLMLGMMIAANFLAAPALAAPRLQNLPGKHETARTVVLSADVACPPARSYAMWATETGARSFFAPAAHIDREVGGRYAVMFFPDEDPEGLVHGTAGAHLLAAEPDRFLAFEWVAFAGDETKGDSAPPYAPPAQRLPDPLPTWVEIAFTPGRERHPCRIPPLRLQRGRIVGPVACLVQPRLGRGAFANGGDLPRRRRLIISRRRSSPRWRRAPASAPAATNIRAGPRWRAGRRRR
jgi:uncharacterized protein YndB with AHSA1/START domain